MCSAGCASTFECTPSHFCSSGVSVSNGDGIGVAGDVAMLLFFHFNRSYVRLKHARLGPHVAYGREVHRITWLLRSARAAHTRLPIHVVVAEGSERNASTEALFAQLGATTIESPAVRPPSWASWFHKHSFSRIAALALTQFRKVVVLDNDMTMISNVDELAAAETPAMVFHTATVLPRKERSAPTGGLFVLRPSRVEFERALVHLHAMNAPQDHAQRKAYRCYDGSDQEFWRSFYRPLYELPLRYHAHTGLMMNASEWQGIRLMHNIQGFRAVYMRLPHAVRRHVRFFHGDADDYKKLSPNYKMR